MMDLPAPVSPVRIFKCSEKSIDKRSIRPKFCMISWVNMMVSILPKRQGFASVSGPGSEGEWYFEFSLTHLGDSVRINSDFAVQNLPLPLAGVNRLNLLEI